MRKILGASLSVGALVAAVVAAAPAATAAPPPPLPPGVSVLAGGFVNPAHISFGPHGTLYVADMGTGSVTRVKLRTGAQSVVASGLGLAAGVDVDSQDACSRPRRWATRRRKRPRRAWCGSVTTAR